MAMQSSKSSRPKWTCHHRHGRRRALFRSTKRGRASVNAWRPLSMFWPIGKKLWSAAVLRRHHLQIWMLLKWNHRQQQTWIHPTRPLRTMRPPRIVMLFTCATCVQAERSSPSPAVPSATCEGSTSFARPRPAPLWRSTWLLVHRVRIRNRPNLLVMLLQSKQSHGKMMMRVILNWWWMKIMLKRPSWRFKTMIQKILVFFPNNVMLMIKCQQLPVLILELAQ